MGLFTILARGFIAPRKKQSLAERLTAAPLSPRRLERRRVLDASAAGALLAPLGSLSEFVQVGDALDSPPPQSANGVDNGGEENTPPDNLQIVDLDNVFEDGIAKLTFSFDDPDFEDTHTVEIDWDDGTAPETINLGPGERFVSTTHQYLDDNPTDTPMDVRHVQVTVTDSFGGEVSDSAPINVINVAPKIDKLSVTSPINENDFAELQLTFTDPGSLDTHTVEIDWGDGTPTETINLTGGERFLQTTHQYLDDNPTFTTSDMYEVKVTVTDDDTGSDSANRMVEVKNVAPVVTIEGEPETSLEGTQIDLTSTLLDPGTLDTFAYAWDVTINGNLYASGASPTFSFTPADDGLYVVTLTVSDDDFGIGTDEVMISVENVAPTVTLNPVMMINENDFAELQLTFTDPGLLDTHTVEIDWGDGTPIETINLTGGERFLQTTHQYLDDNPTFTTSDMYQVKVTVTDDDTGEGLDEASVLVKNVNPVVMLDPVTAVIESGVAMLTGSFTDVGTLDTHTAMVSWGDGTTSSATIVELNGSGTLSASHQYLDNDADNEYTITVTVLDDDTGPGVTTVPVTVFNVNPTFVDVDPMGPNVIVAADVNTKGETILIVQFFDPGTESEFVLNPDQSPFEILVDWGENPAMPGSSFVVEVKLTEVPMGVIMIPHKYLGPPDPLHPTDDILISVKIRDDDFYTPMPFVTDRGESVIETVLISNPGIGAEPFRIDTTPQVPRLQFSREARSDLLLDLSNSAEASLQGAGLRAVSTDSKATTESILELRVIDSYEVEGDGIRLKSEVLNNLPNLFLTLPDNHYAIYLVRIETATERLVIEVYVRNGKVIDPSDDSEGTRDRPPTDEAVRNQIEQILEKTENRPDGSADLQEIRRALEAEMEPGSQIHVEPVVEPDDRGAMLPPGGLFPIAAGLVATGSFGSWAQQIDRAVAQAGPKKWRELRQRSRKKRKNR